jgi:hypothetical protein
MSFFAGQTATAAALNNASGVQEAGGLWRVTNAAATSGTTELAFATTGSLALAASSTYDAIVDLYYTGSVANDQFFFRIRDTNTAGTQRAIVVPPVIATASGGPYFARLIYTFTTSTAANFVFAATMARNAGTGTCQALAGSRIKVELAGSSTVYATA